MATIPWLVDVLRGAGVPVVIEGDWLNRMRPGSFNPIGVLWHHTAGSTTSASNPHPSLNICINGRPDLAGPLCQALVDYNGVFHVISAGRCNHAGEARASGPIPAGDGNTMLIGWEIDYNGVSQSMSTAQYNNSLKATAAVLRQLGRDASYARGHRETSVTGKIDPSFVDLNVMRADVARLMNPAPTWTFTVDNSTADRFTASANWGTSSYSTQRFGADYRFAEPVAASDPAWYKFPIPENGNYRVEAWWPALPGYNTAAPYVVVTSSGNQSVQVNQTANGGGWRVLGTFAMTAGDENKVGVSRWTSGVGLVIADAVRVTRV
jgi:hypothetical protein